MESASHLTVRPSPHVLSLAGVDLVDATPPLVRVEEAREVAVVLSRSRVPEREVFLERCRRDGVAVVVRPSGGGAVVLAPGVVVASALLVAPPDVRFPDPCFRSFGAVVAGALAECGAPGLVMRGVSDLCLGERKVAGSSLRLWRERVLYQVSVLVDTDVTLLARYLPMPTRQPAYRAGRSHRGFVVTLREAGFALTAAEVAEALRPALSSALAGSGLRVDRPSV